MVGGVGWGCCSPVFFRAFRAPVLQTLQKQNCDGGGAGSPGGSLGRLRASSSPGVGWGWGRSCRAGVRRLCAEALKLCVMRSLHLLSLSPSLSPSVSAGRCQGCCSLETVGGWEIGTAGRGWLGCLLVAGLGSASPGRSAGCWVLPLLLGLLLPLWGAVRVVLLLGFCFSLLGWGWPVIPWAASAPAGR